MIETRKILVSFIGIKQPEDDEIWPGVVQGFIVSPLLFNVYSAYIFQEALIE